jgi:hypothetical protein
MSHNTANIEGFDKYVTPVIMADAKPKEKYPAMQAAHTQLNVDYFSSGIIPTERYILLHTCLFAAMHRFDMRGGGNDSWDTFGGMPLEAVKRIVPTLDIPSLIEQGRNARFQGPTQLRLIGESLPEFPTELVPQRVHQAIILPLRGRETKQNSIAAHVNDVGGDLTARKAVTAVLAGLFTGRTARHIFNIDENTAKDLTRRATLPVPKIPYTMEALMEYYRSGLSFIDKASDPQGEKIGAFPLLGVRDNLYQVGAQAYREYEQNKGVQNGLPWHVLHSVVTSALGIASTKLQKLDSAVKDLPDDLGLTVYQEGESRKSKGTRRELMMQLMNPNPADPHRIAATYIFLMGSKPDFFIGPVRQKMNIDPNFSKLAPEVRAQRARELAKIWMKDAKPDAEVASESLELE